jgi:hypothetical protein
MPVSAFRREMLIPPGGVHSMGLAAAEHAVDATRFSAESVGFREAGAVIRPA